MNGGRFDFDDGGTYCGGWEDGKAHGHGVCTGPKGQGEYSGAWHYGFEVSGVYAWPSGNTYEGQWQNGKRHGLGIERRGRWVYRGEWTQGYKGRYGVRHSTSSNARYTGTWANGLQDGYGTENYADGGTYQGQWLRGMRHGYGVRKSAPFSIAAKYRSRSHAHASLTSLRSNQDVEEEEKGKKGGDENRGGFVLRARSEPPARRRSLSERSIAVKRTILQGLRIKKQKSTGDIVQRIASGTGSIRSSGSTVSWGSDESAWTGYNSGSNEHESLLYLEFVDPNATEIYMGEWKNDKRSGFGVCERSDGLKYEGEWYNNKKFGYGVTTFKDGSKEEGKYKNNILLTSQRKKHLLFVRSSKLRERIDSAVAASNRAAQIAGQKAEIALARTGTADDRAEQADLAALQAQEDSDIARLCAKQFAPDFHQPGTEILKKYRQEMVTSNYVGAQIPQAGRLLSPHGRGHRSLSLLPPVAPQFTVQDTSMINDNQAVASAGLHPEAATSESGRYGHADHISQDVFCQKSEGQIPSNSKDYGAESKPAVAAPSKVTEAADAGQAYGKPLPQTAPMPPAAASSSAAERSTHVPDGIGNETPLSSRIAAQKPAPAPYDTSDQKVSMDAMGTGEKVLRTLRPVDQTGATSAMNKAPSRTGSKHSLNQIMNDYFDQYTIAANPRAARLYEANLSKQNRTESTTCTSSERKAYDKGSISDTLTRRSTFAASKDLRRGMEAGHSRTRYPFPSIVEANDVQPTSACADEVGVSDIIATSEEPQDSMLNSNVTYGRGGQLDTRGSLPDLIHLDRAPLLLTREEIARLSSQRRQELLRDRKEVEMIRRNPLRIFLLLLHPEVKAWMWRWKLPLFILFMNMALSLIFYHLLMSGRSDHNAS